MVWTEEGRKSLPSSEVMGIRRTGEDIKESYNFYFENHEKLSLPDVSSAGNCLERQKRKRVNSLTSLSFASASWEALACIIS